MKNTVKQWISLSLLSLMLVKVWVIPLLYLDFEIRRDYIVANLCENRDRPIMNCNGKCYLAKRIAALDEQEKRQAEQNYMSRLLDHVMDQQIYYSFVPETTSYTIFTNPVFTYSSPFTARVAVDDIFHPPLA
ncbi:hypothetical protein [Dyadobacter bucti]|uniref:hypothetical protein n=1 Tax=Dyadobacter bucti TaxID=2572203 RepID=UPI001E3C1781|nr:hypothetical protein [Dyadobacter bucti]